MTLHTSTRAEQIALLEKDWAENPRWKGVKRGYTAADVVHLRGSLQPQNTLAELGAQKLWNYVNNEPYINCLGALTGGQAVQQVKAGVKAIYLSGWQVAADKNALVYQDLNTTVSVIRDLFNSDISKIFVDSKKLHKEIKSYLELVQPAIAEKVDFTNPHTADSTLLKLTSRLKR